MIRIFWTHKSSVDKVNRRIGSYTDRSVRMEATLEILLRVDSAVVCRHGRPSINILDK